MSSRILSKMQMPDSIRQKQVDKQRIVSKFIEKTRKDYEMKAPPYLLLVILDSDWKAYEPEYGIFYRLKPTEPDEEIAYKEGDYVLFRKVDEDYRPELEEDSIEPEVSILQDVDDETEIEAHMFFSDVIYTLFVQIYSDKIIYARTILSEMMEATDSDRIYEEISIQ